MIKRPILLVDAQNVFIRAFSASPAMSAHGEHAGGILGFLGMLRLLIEELRPREVVVVWEGGGSTRRRQLYPDYKMKRRPQRHNRFYGDDIPDTPENRDDQIKGTVTCLKHVPVCQVYVPDCEADDVIAYYCRTRYRDENVVIVSSDRDFYQLLDEKTRIFRPGKKVYVTKDDVVREFAISPRNFSLAKAICGDAADNIPGVKGVGFKTVAKRFPSFGNDEELDVDTLLTEARERAKGSRVKAFGQIVDAEDTIKRNMRLIELDGSMLNPEQRRKADYVVDTFEPSNDKMGLIRELMRLGLIEFNVDNFFYTLTQLVGKKK